MLNSLLGRASDVFKASLDKERKKKKLMDEADRVTAVADKNAAPAETVTVKAKIAPEEEAEVQEMMRGMRKRKVNVRK